MSRDDLHFRLRIPPDLKERVEAAAKENKRSMTAEIVARLEASFDLVEGDLDDVGAMILRSVLNRMADLAPEMTTREAADAMNIVFPKKARPDAS